MREIKHGTIFPKNILIHTIIILVCTINSIKTDASNNLNPKNISVNSNNQNKSSIVEKLINSAEIIAENEVKEETQSNLSQTESSILTHLEESIKNDHVSLFNGLVTIEKLNKTISRRNEKRNTKSFIEILRGVYEEYERTHVVQIRASRASKVSRLFKLPGNSFMTGFGLGFLAFGIKKLLLPVFIGAQIVKSVLIAMFLPTILSGFTKLVGKGLSSFSGASSHPSPQQMEDFDFKDPEDNNVDGYSTNNNGDNGLQDYSTSADSSYGYPAHSMKKIQSEMAVSGLQQAMNRYSPSGHKVNYVPQQSDNYYMQKPVRNTQNFKIFHKIPSSSLLLTSYDPFYSPLLSRLDAIFKQVGIGHQSEKCRERLVCLMYANPAKYAPYSNLISAQLSRELNELRKPTSDNPDILRFFKYMKAAKDGQDGNADCPTHISCPELSSSQSSPAMLTTFNDINRLVHARGFQ